MHHTPLMITLVLALLSIPFTAIAQIQVGADQVETILQQIGDKKIGMTVNHTSILTNPQQTHLVDTLLSRGANILRLYTPEHGLRGTADAGATIQSGKDSQTGLSVISLYGKNKKPTPHQLHGIDLMLFDLQDVGVRFYTYISTLTYVMEACAEQNIPILILDRPNPHDTIDGPVRHSSKYRSFVSLLPIPAVHGLTLGEAAQMINGEGWLKNEVKADLSVVTIKGWKHGQPYSLPVPPSPNLRSDTSIARYPTLCYIEATSWSEGRGTKHPFEQIGYPHKQMGNHTFTPRPTQGASKPKHSGKKCYGPDLNAYQWDKGINLQVLIDADKISQKSGIKLITKTKLFDLLAGNNQLRQQIEKGIPAGEIRSSWQEDLRSYKQRRSMYLLYPDY